MTAYEFTKLNYSQSEIRSSMVKNPSPKAVADTIVSNMKVNLRGELKYSEARDLFIELTMSCDKEEARSWIGHWMLCAIVYRDKTGDLDWRYFFLSAYDIYRDLKA